MARWTKSQLSCLSVLLVIAGCAATVQTADRMPRAGRAAEQREQLIKPGKFGENGAADVRRRFFDFWNEQVIREDAAVSTIFLGDSITELWDLPVYFAGTRGLIQNRGISGDLASVMAKRFQADVVQLRPRVVVVLAGTNDVSSMINAKKNDQEIIDSVTGSVESIMDQARAAGIRCLICSILPTNSDYRMHAQGKALRAQINDRLKAACTAKSCIYVDYAAEMRDENGDLRKDLARDGLHPHYAGYEIMSRVLQQAARVNAVDL